MNSKTPLSPVPSSLFPLPSARRGSALLIVLGMMAFMVISAVAFSAYMRYSRLPSSYLRRSSASRLLAKAALAEAIDEIDAAIGNNPHPGLGTHYYTYDADSNSRRTGTSANRNGWYHRVYLGMEVVNGENVDNKLVSADETVSTLTLEGLAYIPPPLINEARYYSRRSAAAQWKTLDFEAGRYAFCALDVSDFLDVNSLAANCGRGSSAATRYSLAYALEDPNTHASYEVAPAKWDDFIKRFWTKTSADAAIGAVGLQQASSAKDRTSSSRVPLVSVADFNLALHALGGLGQIQSPFCTYLENTSESIYGGNSETSPYAERIRGMSFVTDGYFPPDREVASGDVIDLASEPGQPFAINFLEQANTSINDIQNTATPAAIELRKFISKPGLISLYDYLDDDNVPASLAVPSVERVPMVAAIEQNVSAAHLAFQSPAPGAEYCVQTGGARPSAGGPGQQSITMQQETIYKLDAGQFSAPGTVKVVVTYPFRRGTDLAGADDFRIDGYVEFFFTSGDFNFRTGSTADCLHLKPNGMNLEPENACNGVFGGMLSEQDFHPNNPNPQQETDSNVIKEFTLRTQNIAGQISSAVSSRPFLTVVKEWTENWVPNPMGGGTWQRDASSEHMVLAKADNSAQTSCGIPPLTVNGEADPDFATPATLAGWLNGGGSRNLQLRMVVWVRVRNGDGKTVDLVPACLFDDHTATGQNDSNGNGGGPRAAFVGQGGAPYPVMRFTCPAGVTVSAAGPALASGTSAAFDFQPTAVMCPDPRWNWAPEHWFATGAATAQGWRNDCGCDGAAGRDSDIFMATSDAGYMQSVYELAFLPRVTNFTGGYGNTDDTEDPADGRTEWATAIGGIRNFGFMWKTYRPYNLARAGDLTTDTLRDPFEQVGLVNDGGGMRINPYSDCTNVIMAAFANTPCDWWAAATEADTSVGVPSSDRSSAENFNRKYAFNAMNSNAKFAWKDLYAIAQQFIGCVRRRVNFKLDNSSIHAWKECFDGVLYNSDGYPNLNPSPQGDQVPDDMCMDWNGNDSEFCGLNTFVGPTDTLFDVDRKFLYGYWRECFAAKQQLFLVFVRAEPTMTGGSGLRNVPPQLGARAVALVWRDPTPSPDDRTPHRTRILFYRQFD